MEKENKEKFEKMVCEALTKYYDDIHNYIYQIIKIPTNCTGDNK